VRIVLHDDVRLTLEKLASRHTTGQQIAQRARIVLNAAAGLNHAQIAHTLGISVDMATLWRRRWVLGAVGGYQPDGFECGGAVRGFATSGHTASFHGRSGVSDRADGL